MATPAPTGTPAPKNPGGNVLSEAIAQLLTVAGLTAAANWVNTHLGGFSGVRMAFHATRDDFNFGDRHDGVVRARRINWFWWAALGVCVLSGIPTAHIEGRIWNFVWAMFIAHVGLWIYALPVKGASSDEHELYRKPLDKCNARIEELEEKEFKTGLDARERNNLAGLRSERITRQNEMDAFVRSRGANNRHSFTVLCLGWIFAALAGIAIFVGILRAHALGVIALQQSRSEILHIWPLSAIMFGIPLMIACYAWVALSVPFIKAESLWIFLRRSVSAGLQSGIDYSGLAKQEADEAKARGDDDVPWFAIFNYRGTRMLGMLGVKWMLASILGWLYALPEVTETAFWSSIILFFITEFLIWAFGNSNEHRLRRAIIFQCISALTTLPYVHFFFAGRDATPNYTPYPDWWFKAGPFGPPGPDTSGIQAAGQDAYNTAAPVVEHQAHNAWWYLGTLWNMSLLGWLVLVGIAALIGFIGLKHFTPMISAALETIKNKHLRWLAVPVGFAIVAIVLFGAFGVVYHAGPRLHEAAQEVNRELVRTSPRVASVAPPPCRVDPTGQNRPECRPECYLAQNREAPNTPEWWARDRGTICFEP